jgi:hypothetical protein
MLRSSSKGAEAPLHVTPRPDRSNLKAAKKSKISNAKLKAALKSLTTKGGKPETVERMRVTTSLIIIL